MLVVRCESALLYFNVDHVREQLLALLAARPDPVRLVVFFLGAVPKIDLAGAGLLQRAATDVSRARYRVPAGRGPW